MSYSAIANSEIDASSPLTETLMTKIRDNIEGHNHSEATTTDIVNAGLQAYTAGDYLIQSNDTERSTTSGSYVKLKEIKVLRAGAYRIKFDIKADGASTAYGRIYKNGSAVGTERSTMLTGDDPYSEDISSIVSGDLIQIYCKQSGGTNAYVNDFRIYCAEEGLLLGY